MNSTLRNKAIFVLAVLLICVYGIIGLPKNQAELVKNWNENIKLGLDLKGGSQLVLQVQVQDACPPASPSCDCFPGHLPHLSAARMGGT